MTLIMTDKAVGLSYDAYIAAGWSDALLVEHGLAQAPAPVEIRPGRNDQGTPITYNPDYVARAATAKPYKIGKMDDGSVVARVEAKALRQEGNQLLVLVPLIADMKAAGVPLEGALSFCLVSRGYISMGLDGTDCVIAWWPK